MKTPFRVGSAKRLRLLILLSAFLLTLVPRQSFAKTIGLTAIEIYPGSGGQSFVQIADFVFNGKNEVYLCTDGAGIDKAAYHKLAKVTLAPGMSLERDAKGVLTLTRGEEAPTCSVPGNLKLEKGDAYSLSDLADKAVLEGRVLSGLEQQVSQIPPLKPGVKLVFVAAPDLELAEYLRAERAGDIRAWQGFLSKFATGEHSSTAKKSLARLYVQAGTSAFQAFEKSQGSENPAYGKLKDSRQLVDQSRELIPTDPSTIELDHRVHAEVIALSTSALGKLDLYRQALKGHTPGYANLVTAEKLADGAFEVEPSSPEVADAENQTKQARASFEKILRDCDSLIASKHLDEAAQTILPLRAFAEENPKVSQYLHAISALYVASAKKLEEEPNWGGAAKALTKAADLSPSPDVMSLLKAAKEQEQIAATKAAAIAATQKSEDLESSGNIISAYEVLDDLPREQRALVVDRLEALKDKYLDAAQAAARGQKKAHEPINGLSDEIGIQKAYDLLQRCYRINNDPNLKTPISFLAEDLSAYYLKQGRHYLGKPDGTGANAGWKYLTEALQYRSPSNSSEIHDELEKARQAHLLKSVLSVLVDFRDQTSRRENDRVAGQLTDAFATGLESSGLSVKVIRNENTVVPPNFHLIGDVLQHDMVKPESTVTRDSMYGAGEEKIPNEAWILANRDVQHVSAALQTARSQFDGAVARGHKKEISDAKSLVDQDQAKLEDLQAKLDAIPRETSHRIERPYRYSEVTYSLKITVALQFRILDSTGTEVVPRNPIQKEFSKSYTVLKDVKPEDTKGIRSDGTVPNDNEYFDKTTYEARDELIKAARQKVSELPGIVLATGDRKARDGDFDGAAELYILYLNCTQVADTPERTRARQLLIDQFNFRDIGRDANAD